MSVLDVFVLQYRADTAQAEAAIDALEKKAQSAAKNIPITASVDTAAASAAIDALEKKLNGITQSRNININFTNSVVPSPAIIGATIGRAAAVAFMQAARIPVPPGAGGGGAGGRGGAGGGGAGGAGGRFASSVLGQLNSLAPGLSHFVGIIGSLGPVLAVAAAGALTFKLGIEAANKAVESFKQLKTDAWASGVTERTLTRQHVIGERLNIANAEVTQSMKGFTDKVKQIGMLGASGAYINYGDPTLRLKQFFDRTIGTPVSGRGQNLQVKSLNVSIAQITEYIRQLDKSEGRNRALAVATQHFGLTLEFARKKLEASSDQIKASTEGVNAEVASRIMLTVESNRLANAQLQLQNTQARLSRTIASESTPAMVNLLNAMNQTQGASDSLATTLGKLSASMLNFAADAVTGISELMNRIPAIINDPSILKKLSERKSAVQEEAAELARRTPGMTLGEAAQQVAEKHGEKDFTQLLKSIERGVFDPINKAKKEASDDVNRAYVSKTLKEDQSLFTFGDKGQTNRFGATRDIMAQAVGIMRMESGSVKPGSFDEHLKAIIDGIKGGNDVTKEQLKAQQETNKLLFQTANVTLEQAFSMWASGLGKAGGMQASTEMVRRGVDRKDYEDAYRTMREKLSGVPTVGIGGLLNRNRPNAGEFYDAANKQIERATAPSNTKNDQSRSVTVGDVHITSSATDPVAAGQQMHDMLSRQVFDLVSEYSGPTIS